LKDLRRRVTATAYTAPFLALAYVAVLAVSILLSGKGIPGIFTAELFNNPSGVLVLVVVPCGLLVFLGIFLYGNITHTLQRDGSSRFRFRLFLQLVALVALVTVPPSAIGGRFVGSALDAWFGNSVSASLVKADELSGLLVTERSRYVELTARKFLNGLAIGDYRLRPSDWMGEMRRMDSGAAACQVYLLKEVGLEAEYEPILETGDSTRFVPRDRLDAIRDGFFSLGNDVDLFRFGQVIRYGRYVYAGVYTSVLPEGFSAGRAAVLQAAAQAQVVDSLRPYLPYLGLWVFLLFVLPSTLMGVVLAWYLSARIAAPIRAINEAAGRLAGDDPSFILVPSSNDELGETALFLNAIAARLPARKKKLKIPDKAPPSGV